MPKKNRLRNQRGYLCGPMDHAPDAGVGWRRRLIDDLHLLDITWLDPTNKPCDTGMEGPEEVTHGKRLMDEGRYDEAVTMFTEITNIDMELVSLSNFIVARLDLTIPSCGTHWEMALADFLNKPVLTWVVQGKNNAPRWLLGRMPHQMIFGSAEELRMYLAGIAYDEVIETHGRWKFFDIGNSESQSYSPIAHMHPLSQFRPPPGE